MIFSQFFWIGNDCYWNVDRLFQNDENGTLSIYRYKILSIERAAPKGWSEYTTDELKSEKLIK